MNYRRSDAEGSAFAAALVLLALFFAFILIWQGVKILFSAFAAQPKNPLLWGLLATSIVSSIIAAATQGNPVALCFAAASWTALVAFAAYTTQQHARQTAAPQHFDDLVHPRW